MRDTTVWQTYIALAAVGCASAWLIRRAILFFRNSGDVPGCSTRCGTCPARSGQAAASPEIVELDLTGLSGDSPTNLVG
jgi:hypothetical protein